MERTITLDRKNTGHLSAEERAARTSAARRGTGYVGTPSYDEDASRRASAAKRARRKREWERKVRRARMIRCGVAAALVLMVSAVAAAHFLPEKGYSVFHEATEGQTVEMAEVPETEAATEAETEVAAEAVPETEAAAESAAAEQTVSVEVAAVSLPSVETTPAETTAAAVSETLTYVEPTYTPSDVIMGQDLTLIQSQMPSYVTQQFLPINEYSRPGTALATVNNIVIHYVGNPNTTAQANWEYFEGLAYQSPEGATKASSNFIVGLDGEILNCIPVNEIAYCSNQANTTSLSIEVCHPDAEGKFNDQTYWSLVRLTAWLCEECGLDETNLLRHYDITSKECPKYYVDHPEAWEQLKADVGAQIRADLGQ